MTFTFVCIVNVCMRKVVVCACVKWLCVCVCVFLRHLEQSCPLQPWLQWHLFGRMHRPPFRQGAAHTAVDGTTWSLSSKRILARGRLSLLTLGSARRGINMMVCAKGINRGQGGQWLHDLIQDPFFFRLNV